MVRLREITIVGLNMDVHCMRIFAVIFREQTCGNVVRETVSVFSSGEVSGIASISSLYH